MDFESQLHALARNNDDEMSKKYEFVIDQLLNDQITSNLSELGEDENDIDYLDDEDIGEEEPNEIPKPANYQQRGDDLLQ